MADYPRLRQIEQRRQDLLKKDLTTIAYYEMLMVCLNEDIPWLLAEIRRLRSKEEGEDG